MKIIIKNKEKKFWNNENIVSYFANKPPDPRILKRLKLIKNIPSRKSLDLGCGGGRHTELLKILGFDTYACDINPKMIFYTKQRLSKFFNNKTSLLNKKIIYSSILDLKFPDNYFDVIITTGVLHQAKSYKDYKKAILELSRVLKKNGIVCLNIFTNKVLDNSFTKYKKEKYTVITKEGLVMTLLPKEEFYKLMFESGISLEEELSEDIKKENTGTRSILRANFKKL